MVPPLVIEKEHVDEMITKTEKRTGSYVGRVYEKENKGNHRNNNAGSGSYPAVSGCFYSSKETGKTELKTDRKEQITSEQETKRSI